MATALLAARVLLSAVLVVAAVGKLVDLRGSARALVGFGVGQRVARVGGAALPLVEFAAAVALIVRPTSVAGAALTLALMVVFTAAIAAALARGEAPDCNCFGQLHSAPAGSPQIIRNVLLGGVAVFVIAAGPGPGMDGWLASHGVGDQLAIIFGASATALLALSALLWRQRDHLQASLRDARKLVDAIPPGLPIGSPAPELRVRDLDAAPFTLSELRARGLPVILIFGAPGCGPCSALMPDLPRWREAFAERLTLGFVGLGLYRRYEEASAKTGLTIQEIHEHDSELASELHDLNGVLGSYRLHATPSAVLITPEGTIASATVDGRLAIMGLIRLAAGGRGPAGLAARRVVVA